MTRQLLGALFTIALASGRAGADDEPFTIGAQPAWFLLGGVTTGGTIARGDRGAFLGGEVSLARVLHGNHVGVYADGAYDWGSDRTCVTGGVEAGWKLVGIDAGAALRLASDDTQAGFAARLSVGLGVFNVFVRYARFDATRDENVLQLGATIKLPLLTLGGPR